MFFAVAEKVAEEAAAHRGKSLEAAVEDKLGTAGNGAVDFGHGDGLGLGGGAGSPLEDVVVGVAEVGGLRHPFSGYDVVNYRQFVDNTSFDRAVGGEVEMEGAAGGLEGAGVFARKGGRVAFSGHFGAYCLAGGGLWPAGFGSVDSGLVGPLFFGHNFPLIPL